MSVPIGVVVIGRNEGERLVACLESLDAASARAVYVDSGSTDGSQEAARSRGIEVVELDMSTPFTAARARQAGVERLLASEPQPEVLQFVDGDCTLADGWLQTGAAALAADDGLAVVSGRLRERHPQASIYNLLCDVEWNTPVGPALACGGNAMMRAAAYREVGGFDPTLIAGEEPELCYRLRQRGWRIERLAAEMGMHDAAMTRFSQWWTRAKRYGFATAQNARLHGAGEEGFARDELRRILSWGLGLPALTLAAVSVIGLYGLLVLGLLGLQFLRLALRHRGLGALAGSAYALACVLTPFAAVLGVLRFHRLRLGRRAATVIEYK